MNLKCICGNEFLPRLKTQKYCCGKCRTKYGVRAHRVRTQTYCFCGERKDVYSNKCQKCFTEEQQAAIKSMTIGEYRNKLSVKDKHPSWVSAHIRNFNRSWNKHLTLLPCANCGYDKHVELCHITAIKSFSDETLIRFN